MQLILSRDLKLLKVIGLRFSQILKQVSFLYQVLNINIKGNNLGHSGKNHSVTSVTILLLFLVTALAWINVFHASQLKIKAVLLLDMYAGTAIQNTQSVIQDLLQSRTEISVTVRKRNLSLDKLISFNRDTETNGTKTAN